MFVQRPVSFFSLVIFSIFIQYQWRICMFEYSWLTQFRASYKDVEKGLT